MNENQIKPNNLIDTTDCLEAVGVFRGWKNFLFFIVVICLLLLQISFWLVDIGYVETFEKAESESAVVAASGTKQADEVAKEASEETNKIGEAAKKVAGEPEEAAEVVSPEPQEQQPETKSRFWITFKQLSWLIRFLNFVVVLAAILYCLTMLFSLKVSLLGRLGGINHISRAFFLSLVFLVFLLPWHLPWKVFFGRVVVLGAIYTPEELLSWYGREDEIGIFGAIVYYLRFTGYWLLVSLLLVFSQLRSMRWAKDILRRLEII